MNRNALKLHVGVSVVLHPNGVSSDLPDRIHPSF